MSASDHRLGALCELGARVAGATGLEDVADAALVGLDELLGYRHSLLLVHQVETDRLVTFASRGYATGGIGSEVALGEGVIGMAAERRRPMRIGNLQRMLAYARTVQRAADSYGGPPGSDICLPGLSYARSQLAAPMVARGALVGVVAVESEQALAFDTIDEQILTVVAQLVGAALDLEHVAAADAELVAAPTAEKADARAPVHTAPVPAPPAPVRLRHYLIDGSVFIDDAYIIKGVAGRLLWKLASEFLATGRTAFTNREARLDPSLELPAFRDNFESRLILLKRRLEERDAPLRITAAGRGRFDFRSEAPLVLERMEPD